jgi:hypothetical protein
VVLQLTLKSPRIDILEDPILLSADIICLTEANFYSGDNMKIDKYNCTQLPMDANSNTHGIMICVKESLKTEVIRVVRLPVVKRWSGIAINI